MYNHLCKTIKCSTDYSSLKYSDNEIIKYSLLNNLNTDIKLLNKDYKITKTSLEYITELKDIYKTNRKICNYCNKIFSKYKELENHLSSCINIDNNNTINTDKSLNIDILNNISNNITYNNIVNNNIINNNYNININLTLPDKTLISFDKDWNTEHLDMNTKLVLFLSNFTHKYSKTLEVLLENDLNKNVLLDNESNVGIIYKNETFEKKKIKDIVSESIEKLHKHLNNFSKEILEKYENINNEIIKSIAKDTRFELLNYKNQKEHNIDLSSLIISTYNKFKIETKNQYIQYQEQQDQDKDQDQNKDQDLEQDKDQDKDQDQEQDKDQDKDQDQDQDQDQDKDQDQDELFDKEHIVKGHLHITDKILLK
jgi:hypothetical protein